MSKLLALFHKFRSLGTDTLWAIIQDATLIVVGLSSFLMIPRALGTGSYGIYLGAYGAIAPLTGLAWNGVSLVVLQMMLRESDDPSKVLQSCLGLSAAIGAVTASAAFFLTRTLIPELSDREILGLVLAEAGGAAVIGILAAAVQASAGYGPSARVRIGQHLLKFMVVATLFVTGTLTVQTLGTSMAIVLALYAAFLLLWRMPTLGIRIGIRKPERDYQKASVAFSLPILVSSIQTDGDKTALASYGHKEVAGQYGAAFKLVQFAMMPINAFDAAAFQRFLSHDPDAKGQHLRRARLSVSVTIPFSLAIVVVLFFMAPLLPVLVGDTFGDSVEMTRWLLLFIPIFAMTTAPMNALIGLGRVGLRAAIHVAAAVVSLVSYVVLIPSLTWRGGLIGTLLGEAVIASGGWLSLVYFQRQHDAEQDRKIHRPVDGVVTRETNIDV